MLQVALLCLSHVPTYSGCADRCCTPPHHHTVSQVIYVAGSGGLEVHCSEEDCPFDVPGGEIIDVDAVFKHEYDQSTYSLYIGCGGCVASVDPVVIGPVALNGYEPGEVEPFTQTSYRSVFEKDLRKFNTQQLANCSENHFTIRIIDFHNRTDGSELIWGAVIGLKESFTFQELVSFPIYVLRNHNESWNQLGWTYWLILPCTLLLWWFDRANARRCFEWKWVSPFDEAVSRKPRAWLYDLAIVAFLASGLEMFVHLCVAQSNAEFGYQFWVGLIGVILIAHGIPLLITFFSFQSLYHPTWTIAAGWWAPIELATAFSYLFFFGAGFFVGPLLIACAGFIRLFEWAGWEYAPVFTGTPASAETASLLPQLGLGI